MNRIYLLLGSNLGNSKEQLLMAAQQLHQKIGPVIRESSLYQTAAWGYHDQPDFVNQVLLLRTSLDAEACISNILAIEKKMGRLRTTKNAPRIIDIDILYFNSDIIQLPHLQVPHPAIHQRRFVLIPLTELAADFIHPKLNKTNARLLAECSDELDVKKI
ncbi:MAG: 2-amino-4-hydroxy-6-hydroxymethyldihydropteridine diphosphokinase [Chitinophagaceae bacterium]|nr:MAG: 2-amino-4-hydroxy-6-hydroxymethyldihydropteridine diphosphokinase [Chitinophagaceae bacterium]